MPLRLRDRGIEKLKREANIRRCIEKDYAGEKLSVTGAAIMGSLDEFSLVRFHFAFPEFFKDVHSF